MDSDISTTDIIVKSCFCSDSRFHHWTRKGKHTRSLRDCVRIFWFSLGAAAFTILSLELFYALSQIKDRVNIDPLRILNGIMEGLGFLGAGCIIQSRGSVEGITTAATIWVVGAVGLACGAAQFRIAIITTVLAFLVLTALRFIDRRFKVNAAI